MPGEVSDTWRTCVMTEQGNMGASITRRPQETRLFKELEEVICGEICQVNSLLETLGLATLLSLCTHFFLCKSLDKHRAVGEGYLVYHLLLFKRVNTAVVLHT